MNIKKIVASAGIAAGALAAFAGTAQANPITDQVAELNPIGKVSDAAGTAGISTLHNTGGGVEMIHDGTSLIGG